MSSVLSVNVGSAETSPNKPRERSGIHKRPTASITVQDPGMKRVENGAGVSGVVADFIGSGKFHGGHDQAVYAVSRQLLDHWEIELDRELANGFFGENLTMADLDVDAAEIGDRWRVGGALLEIRGPRIPCATFAAHMGEPRWVRRFTEHGRTGAYLSVIEPGTISPGDPIAVTPSESGCTVMESFRAFTGDAALAAKALATGQYAGSRADDLASIAKR